MKIKRLLLVSILAATLLITGSQEAGAGDRALAVSDGRASGEIEVSATVAETSETTATEVISGESSEYSYDDEFNDDFDDDFDDEFDDEIKPVWDPVEPINRVFFKFNDKMYFWLIKPASRGYGFIVPEKGRVAIGRFFTNLTTPVRFMNSLFQLKLGKAGSEVVRFLVNSTVGVLGFMDPARDRWNIYLHDEDMGQTLGRYGSGPGFYLVLPVLGPSNVRDSIGMVGDVFLKPTTYIFASDRLTGLGATTYEGFNDISLKIGLYEGLKRDAIDPYSYIRDSYHQYRENKIKE